MTEKFTFCSGNGCRDNQVFNKTTENQYFFRQCQRTFFLHSCNLILNYWPVNTQKLRKRTYGSTISEKYYVCLKGIIYHLWIRLDSLECRK